MNAKRNATVTLLAASMFVGACSVTPDPLTPESAKSRAASDRLKMFDAQEPISGPIGLEEAIARALKYNLDFRLKKMESALSQQLHTVSQYDMLPNVVASAGYATRNNASGGRSVNIDTGLESLSPSTSQDRSRTLASLEFSWNALDFGMSYYRAKQRADEYLVAEERRRRVAQTIVHDVRLAYWRALGAQRLAGEATKVMGDVDRALSQSQAAESRGAVPVGTALAYQRALLDAVALLNVRRQELEFAKTELAALMSVPSTAQFTLADRSDAALPAMPPNLLALEDMALSLRPELREEDYRKRISALETRRQMLSAFPNLSLNFGPQYDSNSLLYNNNWVDGGLRITQSLLRLAALPEIKEAGERQQKTDDARRQALSMAVLTQTRIAMLRYDLAMNDFALARRSSEVDERILQVARSGMTSKVETELEVTRANARSLVSRFQRASAYANAQGAYARIQHSLGQDFDPGSIDDMPLAELTREVSRRMAEADRAVPVSMAPEKTRPTRVWLYTPQGSLAEQMRPAMIAALTRSGFAPVERRAQADVMLKADFTMGAAERGLRRGELVFEGVAPSGKRTGGTRYETLLPSDPKGAILSAVGEAAVLANASRLREIAEVPPAVASTPARAPAAGAAVSAAVGTSGAAAAAAAAAATGVGATASAPSGGAR